MRSASALILRSSSSSSALKHLRLIFRQRLLLRSKFLTPLEVSPPPRLRHLTVQQLVSRNILLPDNAGRDIKRDSVRERVTEILQVIKPRIEGFQVSAKICRERATYDAASFIQTYLSRRNLLALVSCELLLADPYPGEIVEARERVERECLDVNDRFHELFHAGKVLTFWGKNCEYAFYAMAHGLEAPRHTMRSEFFRTRDSIRAR